MAADGLLHQVHRILELFGKHYLPAVGPSGQALGGDEDKGEPPEPAAPAGPAARDGGREEAEFW
jgi:hypothetical protein